MLINNKSSLGTTSSKKHFIVIKNKNTEDYLMKFISKTIFLINHNENYSAKHVLAYSEKCL